MKFNKLIYLIVPILTLANGNPPDNSVEIGDNGTGTIVRHSERATRPGGFSAVAEPDGPVIHSRPSRTTPGQQDSNYYRNLVTVQPVYRRLLRHHTVKDFQGTTSNFSATAYYHS